MNENLSETNDKSISRDADYSDAEYSFEYSQDEAAKAILRERARLLALQTRTNETQSEGTEMVEFVLSGENYAFASTAIREIYPVKEITPLPCTPPFVAGIINLRGQILSVLDLKQLFGLPRNTQSVSNRVLIIGSQEMEIGVIADEVLGVRMVALDDVQALPSTLSGVRSDYIEGVTTDRLILLDAQRLLHDEKIIVNEEVS